MQNSSNNQKKSASRNNQRKNNAGATNIVPKNNKPQKNTVQKKVGLNARNDKAKYSDDEIARARYIDSKAKFLVRDRIHNDNIDTRNKWIGISNIKSRDRWDNYGNYDPEILSFDAEIYDRTEQPVYDDEMTEDEKHKLTYEVAEGDIQKQRYLEQKSHRKVSRPSYHVDVETKYTKCGKTEYQVRNIKRRK